MSHLLQPLAFAALFWWLSTGVILRLIGMKRSTHPLTAYGATATLAAATVAAVALRGETSVWAAYAGFVAGVASWAWHEVMFLLGYVSGPRKSPCPKGLATWPRFIVSAQAVLHHELAIAVHAGLLTVVSLGAENAVAAWTFYLLWGMRISAKLLVFHGAPRLNESWLPAHLSYLATYFSKRSVTALFPILLAAVSAVALWLGMAAAAAPAGSFEATGFLLLAALAALAVFEHVALAAPLPDAALWGWAVRPPRAESANGDAGRGEGRT